MKKLLGLLTISMVCLLTACSMFFTLDVDGNATITVDGIEMNVTNYEHTDGLVNQTAVVTVEFKNTTDKDVEFKLDNSFYYHKDDKEDTTTIIPLSLNITTILSGKLKAGSTAKYSFTVSVNKDEDIKDYKITYTFNEKEIFVSLKDKR